MARFSQTSLVSLLPVSILFFLSAIAIGLTAPTAAWANEPPTITAPAELQRDPGQLVLFNVNTDDPDGDFVTLEAANLPAGSRFLLDGNGNGSFSWRPGDADVGFYPILLIATDDGVPVESATMEVALTIGDPNLPPVLDPIGDREALVGTPLVIPLSADDPEGDSLTFSTDPLLVGSRMVAGAYGQADFEYTPTVADVGNLVLTFFVSDGMSTDEETIVISVGEVNVPPTLQAIGDRQVEVGMPFEVALMAQDADGDGLGFSALGLPEGVVLIDRGDGTGQLSGTPATVGIYGVTVTVTDDGTPPEAAAESFEIDVQPPPPPPVPDEPSLVIVEAEWRWGRLSLTGEGAEPGSEVAIVDPQTGAVLGSVRADEDGLYQLTLRPFLPPCSVEVRSGEEASQAVPVAGAPAGCSAGPPTRVWGALWKCGRGLYVAGHRAPSRGTVRVYDASSDELLAVGRATRSGHFLVRSHGDEAPDAVRVSVEDGGLEWMLDPVEVRGASRCRARVDRDHRHDRWDRHHHDHDDRRDCRKKGHESRKRR